MRDPIAIFGGASEVIYPGGKNGMGIFQRIINLMPPHYIYVEAFLGSGAILRHKRPALQNIGIDRDERAIALCRSLIDKKGDDRSRLIEFKLGNALELLRGYDIPNTLLYCDPPYVHSTRTRQDVYKYEFSDDDHRALLDLLMNRKSMVMISGYRCPLYDDALSGWNSVDYQAQTRGGPKTETLWFNFDEPTELHDYGFLGSNFRERERIKRKKDRWVARWRSMSRLERQAILSGIKEVSQQVAQE